MRPPEPCFKGRCYSPTACNGWGYCRARNADYPSGFLSDAEMLRLRDQAVERGQKEAPTDAR